MAIAGSRLPVYSPITALMLGMSLIGMFTGLRRTGAQEKLSPTTPSLTLLQTLRGIVYMLHWIVVMASVTARMSVRPKRLKWVKTVHQGQL
jgi:1,2-diacylglycerol 3-beta-glucosyltransferase